MEIERIHNLTEQEAVKRTGLLHSGNSFSERSFMDPGSEDVFGNFSPSNSIQVAKQDCSKRSLMIDGETIAPFKKKKRLLEEPNSYDESFDQNLHKYVSNEGTNVTSCSKVKNENFTELVSSTSEKGDKESQIEFNLQSSVFVKEDDSKEWVRLRCFDSIPLDGSNRATFFTGGPIQSSAFSITPDNNKVNQYVAVAVSNAIYKKLSYTNIENVSGIIQFWNLGVLHERKTLNQQPLMELALYHDNGIITEMKWCPENCYVKCSTTPKLGLLAVAASDSNVYIYSVPQPDRMPKSETKFPIYFSQPSMKLTHLSGGPSLVTEKAIATSIDWEKNGERIVAGYGNGAVYVWMIKFSRLTNLENMKSRDHPYTIHPYLFFQSSSSPITSLSFAPFSNHRWLVVSTVDGHIRFFDLHDSSPTLFKVMRPELEPKCVWGESFCGVYFCPYLNKAGLISLSAKECCAEAQKREQKLAEGLFDSSTGISVSENGNCHAIADMGGAVIVNFLKNIANPSQTSYLTYLLFETEIKSLDSVDPELKILQSKINISGNILNNEIVSINDTSDTFSSKMNERSSSSSSGICSPKNDKTFLIEMPQGFEDDAATLLQSPLSFSALNNFNNKNIIKSILNKPENLDEETNNGMIKCPESSEDLMHDLLMVKIAKETRSSSHVVPLNNSNNSDYFDSKSAKHICDRTLITSPAASDYTGDTIIYPKEDYFSDTSHLNALKPVKSNAQSMLHSNGKKTLYGPTMQAIGGEPTLETNISSENSLTFPSVKAKSKNSFSNENCSSKNYCKPKADKSNLNSENINIKEINNYSCVDSITSDDFHLDLKHSATHREKYCCLEKSSKEVFSNGDLFKNLDARDDFLSRKDATILPLHENLDGPLCDVLKPNNLNQPKPLPTICSPTTSNSFIFCDKGDQLSGASSQFSGTTEDSNDTIIYSFEPKECKMTDLSCLKSKKLGAIPQSLCKNNQENTFHDTLLHEIDEEPVLHGSKTKLLKDNCFSFNREKYEHFLAKESPKCTQYNSEYGTGSPSENFSSSDEDKSLNWKDLLNTNFHVLHSEYSCDKSAEKHKLLNKSSPNRQNPQELSYENLIGSFGVIFKNHLDESSDLLSKKNGVCVAYNPLSVIKTISWNPNEGCQSWLFLGGNSGIGQLVFVPDDLAVKKKRWARN